MIDLTTFGEGFGVMALQIRQAVGPAEIRAYWLALRDETEPREWERFCAVAARRRGWRFLPPVGEVMDALLEFRGAAPIDVEAVDAYERVMACYVRPEGGDGAYWDQQRIAQQCGKAARDAFLAAGGHEAFANAHPAGVAKRRERFLAAYQHEARMEPTNRLLPPASEAKQLPAGHPAEGQLGPGPEQATAILQRLSEMTGKPAPWWHGKPRPRSVVLTDERAQRLAQQADALASPEERAAAAAAMLADEPQPEPEEA